MITKRVTLIRAVAYIVAQCGGAIKAGKADADATAFIDLAGTTGAAAQLLIASVFGVMISASRATSAPGLR